MTGTRPKMRRFTIAVSQDVINKAVASDSSHCVIADGLRDSIPSARRVTVDLQTIRWTDQNTGLRYIALTPATGQAILVNFDQGIKPQPFSLRVEPFQVTQSVKPGPKTITPGKTGTGGSGGKHTKRPVVEGGALPPTAALSNTRGRRRTFGLGLLTQERT